ncbi:MAG TPA: hypothetical protein VGO60_04360 [Iamia sp.]|jgi:hypothetical protein|nr:hypothetical protein [Iamia sp.]
MASSRHVAVHGEPGHLGPEKSVERSQREGGGVRIRRRRDVERRCVRCGDRWFVPGALAAPHRVSKWQRGISAPDHLGFRGMTTNATASMQLDLAKPRAARLDAQMEVISALATCPGCGGVGTYVEQPVPRGHGPDPGQVGRGRWWGRGGRRGGRRRRPRRGR